jgi:hypothetical protein
VGDEHTSTEKQLAARLCENDGSFFLPNVVKHCLNDYLKHNGLQPHQLTGWSLLHITDRTVRTCPASKNREPPLILLDTHCIIRAQNVPQADAAAALAALHTTAAPHTSETTERSAKRQRRAVKG